MTKVLTQMFRLPRSSSKAKILAFIKVWGMRSKLMENHLLDNRISPHSQNAAITGKDNELPPILKGFKQKARIIAIQAKVGNSLESSNQFSILEYDKSLHLLEDLKAIQELGLYMNSKVA